MTASVPLKVLCVDANRDAATSLVAVLRLAGYDVRYAADAGDGWRVARVLRPDVCVADITGDGGSLAARLRQELGRGVLLIAVTAGAGHTGTLDATEFDWMFRRPVTPADLLRVCGEYAAKRTAGVEPTPRT